MSLCAEGDGGVDELRAWLPESEYVYALVVIPLGVVFVRDKVVLVAWRGPQTSAQQRTGVCVYVCVCVRAVEADV